MRYSKIRYAVAAAASLSLLTSCNGGTTQATPFAAESRLQGKRATSSCPCLYVANAGGNSVTVYASGATGDEAPIQDIQGAATGLSSPTGVAVDAEGNLYVSNFASSSVTVYAADASGDASPVQTIAGNSTQLHEPSAIALSPVNGDIYVENYYSTGSSANGSVTIYPQSANGNVSPSAAIGGSSTKLRTEYGIALDSSGNLYVANQDDVTIYDAGSTGNVAPSRTIEGTRTKLDNAEGITLDPAANIYVTNIASPPHGALTVYPSGSNRNVRPTQYLKGGHTRLDAPIGIALDANGDTYLANADRSSITVFAMGASGNVAPINTIKGRRTLLSGVRGVAIH